MSILNKIKEAIIKKTDEAEDDIVPYGIIGIIGFILFYFINFYHRGNFFEKEGILRVIAGLFCCILTLKNYWPRKTKKFLPLVWNSALLFNIPFFFTFILLKNPQDTLWPIHWVLAFTLLILLVDLISFITLSILGVAFACFVHFLSGESIALPPSSGALLTAYISFATYYVFIFRKRQYKTRFNSLKMQAGAIAHEMRTPLFSMSSIGHELKDMMPILTRSYEEKDPASNEKRPLNKRDIDSMNQLPQEIEQITRQAFSFIDIMLMNLREDFKDAANETCSIKKCVEDALKQYPFFPKDRELLHIQLNENFEFKGNFLLIKHIFFNLLKNSIYYVKAADKGEITIKTTSENGINILSFKDTGAGIAPDILPHIFDKFYSKTKYGTGIGLSFCKDVMNGLGGDITCKSQQGEYTEFILTFPPLERD